MTRDREGERWLEIAEGIFDMRYGLYGRLPKPLRIEAIRAGLLDMCDGWIEYRVLVACLFAALSPAERREIGLPG